MTRPPRNIPPPQIIQPSILYTAPDPPYRESMPMRSHTRCSRLLTPVIMLACSAAPALGSITPPVPSDPGSPNKLALYGIGGFLAILCIVFAIMPSQRTHHD